MGWQVIIAPSAQTDLVDIVRYIAQHNSDAAAHKFALSFAGIHD
jgi:plasmid stabilization system protein ParE